MAALAPAFPCAPAPSPPPPARVPRLGKEAPETQPLPKPALPKGSSFGVAFQAQFSGSDFLLLVQTAFGQRETFWP